MCGNSVLNDASESIGWRALYERLGWLILLFMTPFGYTFYRNQPEHFGILPDGKSAYVDTTSDIAFNCDGAEEKLESVENSQMGGRSQQMQQLQQEQQDSTRGNDVEVQAISAKEAFGTIKFWSNSVGVAIVGLSGATFWFHLKHLTQDFYGIENSRSILNYLYPVIAASNLVGRLLSGIMIDYLRPKKLDYLVLCVCLMMQTITMFIVPAFSLHIGFLYLFCILQGLTDSTAMNVSATVFANSFGRKELNEIQGRADALVVFGSAIGPFPYGYVREVTGSYIPAFLIGSIFPASLMCWVYFSNRYSTEGRNGRYATLFSVNQDNDAGCADIEYFEDNEESKTDEYDCKYELGGHTSHLGIKNGGTIDLTSLGMSARREKAGSTSSASTSCS